MRIEFLKDSLSMIGRHKAGDVEEIYGPYAIVLVEAGLARAAKALKPEGRPWKAVKKGGENE